LPSEVEKDFVRARDVLAFDDGGEKFVLGGEDGEFVAEDNIVIAGKTFFFGKKSNLVIWIFVFAD